MRNRMREHMRDREPVMSDGRFPGDANARASDNRNDVTPFDALPSASCFNVLVLVPMQLRRSVKPDTE